METVDFMRFPAVPTVATSQINRAGRILRKPTDYSGDEFVDAFYLTLQWRACHALPLNTFQSTLIFWFLKCRKLKKNAGISAPGFLGRLLIMVVFRIIRF